MKCTSPPEDVALLSSLFDAPASRASDALAAWDIDKQPESSTPPVNRPVRNTSDKCVDSKAQIPSVYGKQQELTSNSLSTCDEPDKMMLPFVPFHPDACCGLGNLRRETVYEGSGGTDNFTFMAGGGRSSV